MVHNINMHIAIIIGINGKLSESSRTPDMIINKGVPAINIYPAPPPPAAIVGSTCISHTDPGVLCPAHAPGY